MRDIFDLKECILCHKECKKDRASGETGACGASDKILCARAMLHMWEEPCLSGTKGSGAVFFAGCSLSCAFCQNSEISHKAKGIEITKERLCEIFFELENKGAHNINLITAGHFLPSVLDAVEAAKKKGIKIPFIYNTSGYEKSEALARAEGLIDIYLPDFKYMDNERAKKYSKTPDYPDVTKTAIDEMVRQQPECKFSEDGIMTSGVIVRHMMLPEGISDSKRIVRYLYNAYGDKIYISLMSQYTPFGDSKKFPELKRKITKKEYEKLIKYTLSLGVENAFIQEGEAADESFIPDFSGQGIVKGEN